MPSTSPIAYPIVNGVRASFPSVELKLNGQIFIGFKSINYSRTRNRTMVYGNNVDPIGKTRGKNEYKADCELYIAEFHQFLIDTLGGAGYGDVIFNISVTISEPGFDTIADQIIGCTLDSTDASNAEGADPLVRKFELNPIKVIYGGVDDNAIPLVGVQT